jgi:hypothetical protein
MASRLSPQYNNSNSQVGGGVIINQRRSLLKHQTHEVPEHCLDEQLIGDDIDEFFEQNEIEVKAQRNFSSKISSNLLSSIRPHRESAKDTRDIVESLLAVPPSNLVINKQGSFQGRNSS